MIRRLNFTGRRRLLRRDVEVSVRPGEPAASFEAKLNLDSYDLPQESLVFVEAYRQTSWMRFAWGTVGHQAAPERRLLTEFGQADGVHFRVRVTTAGAPKGLLLAQVDGIRPTNGSGADDGRRIPLLPVVPAKDLGDEVFRVDFDGDRPTLQVNAGLGDWRAVPRDEVFQALAYPCILREVLTFLVQADEHEVGDDPEDWRSQWLRFAESLCGRSGDVNPEWVTDVVDAFARRHRLIEKVKPHFGQ